MTTTLTAKLESWQKERDDLKRQLLAHQQRQDVSAADVQQMIEDAVNELETLRETLHDGDNRPKTAELLPELRGLVPAYFLSRHQQEIWQLETELAPD